MSLLDCRRIHTVHITATMCLSIPCTSLYIIFESAAVKQLFIDQIRRCLCSLARRLCLHITQMLDVCGHCLSASTNVPMLICNTYMYLRRYLRGYLGRERDMDGMLYWRGELGRCYFHWKTDLCTLRECAHMLHVLSAFTGCCDYL